jgi:hypothetical protein
MEEFQTPKIFNVSYVLKETIERVWFCVRDMEKFSKINSEVQSPVKWIVGNNTFTVGNEFITTWYGVSSVQLKCIDIETKDYYKKISWEMFFENLDLHYHQSFILYSNSIDKSTLFIWEIDFHDPAKTNFSNEIYEGYKHMILEAIKKIEKYLKSSNENLYQHESVLINANANKVWELLTDWNKFKIIVPIIADVVEYNGDPLNVGTIMKIISKKNVILFLKVRKVDKDLDNYKWEYNLDLIDGKSKAPSQEIRFTLIPIGEASCQLSFLHEFREFIKSDTINSLADNKRDILTRLKNQLENII